MNFVRQTSSRLLRSPWAVVVVVALAAFLRFWKLSEWSLWDDEETTIFFSQHLDKAFPSSFPVFFVLLGKIFQFTGVSPWAGRLLPALMGIVGVWLMYVCFRKLISREVALLAALFLALNLGHLFWSQSVRYYTMVLVLQILSMYWFLEGFECRKYSRLVLSNIAFALAVWTHYSALLLAPVFFIYLVVMMWTRQNTGAYNRQGYVLFFVLLVAIVGVFVSGILQQVQLQGSLGEEGGVIPSARDPFHVILRVGAYFGVPLIALGVLAPLVGRLWINRVMLFFFIASVVPILELVTISVINAFTDFVSVTWYYGFVSLVGFAVLASFTLVSMYRNGWQWFSASLGIAACAYSIVFLVGYYSIMHGDRPRWKEATEYVREVAKIRSYAKDNPEIFATVPGVVAYYLGVSPAETMGHPLVKFVPAMPPGENHRSDQWYLLYARNATQEYLSAIAEVCSLSQRFEAFTGPVDRSIFVYYCARDELGS